MRHHLLRAIQMIVAALVAWGVWDSVGNSIQAQNAKPPEREYIIGIGDILDIQVWENHDFSRKVTVLPDGTITMPLLGDIQAANLSKATFEARLKTHLQKYLKEPLLTVLVSSSAEIWVRFSGVLSKDGSVPRGTTFGQVLREMLPDLQAIQPPPDLARIRIFGVDGEFLINGIDLLSGAAPEANIRLEWGDTIQIPSTIPPPPTPSPALQIPVMLAQQFTLSTQEFEALLQQFPEAEELLRASVSQSDAGLYQIDLSTLSESQQTQPGGELLEQVQQYLIGLQQQRSVFSGAMLMGIAINLASPQYLEAFLALSGLDTDALPTIQRVHVGELVQKGATDNDDIFLDEIRMAENTVILRRADSYQTLSLSEPISQARLSGILDIGKAKRAFFSNLTPPTSRLIAKRNGFHEGDEIENGVTLYKIAEDWALLGNGQDFQIALLRDSRFLTPTLKTPTPEPLEPAAQQVEEGKTVIDVWYGPSQVFGNNGIPQRWINIVGNVTNSGEAASLTYSLNGGPALQLSIGTKNNRLERKGDFNIEIAYSDLLPGHNEVAITYVDNAGNQSNTLVNVEYESGKTCPLPYTIDWSTVDNIQDVAQIVDGKWVLTPEGIRTAYTGYDRLIAIGDVTWRDYEVTVPVTVHGSNMEGVSAPPAIGVILRWEGHHKTGAQPSVVWYPLGAIGWYRFGYGLQFVGGGTGLNNEDSSVVLELETPYIFKMRVETTPAGGALYSFKVWKQGTPEPDWHLVGEEDATDPQQGAVILLTHHFDATFGNVSIVPFPSP